jgi:hypothetical protein
MQSLAQWMRQVPTTADAVGHVIFVDEAASALHALQEQGPGIAAASAWARDRAAPVVERAHSIYHRGRRRRRAGCFQRGTDADSQQLLLCCCAWFIHCLESAPGRALRGHGAVLLSDDAEFAAALRRFSSESATADQTSLLPK